MKNGQDFAGQSNPSRNSNPSHRINTDYARKMTIDAVGWRFARALDQADFLDRAPSQLPHPLPEARSP